MKSDYQSWFARSVGDWVSDRRYLYYSPGKEPKVQNLVTNFTIDDRGEGEFRITWTGKTNGEMIVKLDVQLDGDILYRNIGYFSDEPTFSALSRVDEDTVVMVTPYGGITYREEIRLLENDTLRLRQTVAMTKKGITLAGQYVERRRENDSNPQ